MNKIERHRELCDQIHTTYEKKNHDYGDSFGQSIAEHGYIAGIVRMEDKMNRTKSLVKNDKAHVKDESLCDTLLDLANYAIMLSMEVEKGSKNGFYEKKNAEKLEEDSKKSEGLYGRKAFEKAVELYVQEHSQFYSYSIKYNVFTTQLILIGNTIAGPYNRICTLHPIGTDNQEDVDYFITYLTFNI